MPVVPATQEAEAEESFEPRRRRLQWAEIVPLHSRLATEQDSVKKKIGDSKENFTEEFEHIKKYFKENLLKNMVTGINLIPNAGKKVEQEKLSFIAGRCKMVQPLWKII